jgi:hypothetical protein
VALKKGYLKFSLIWELKANLIELGCKGWKPFLLDHNFILNITSEKGGKFKRVKYFFGKP